MKSNMASSSFEVENSTMQAGLVKVVYLDWRDFISQLKFSH